MIKGQQFEQLPMFMTGKEIKEQYTPADYDPNYGEFADEKEFWDSKLDEANQSGLTQSIKEEGVKTPVILNLDGKTIDNGHHRVAATTASPDDDKYIPVIHAEDQNDSYDIYEDKYLGDPEASKWEPDWFKDDGGVQPNG